MQILGRPAFAGGLFHPRLGQMQPGRANRLRQHGIIGDQQGSQSMQFFRQRAAALGIARAHHNDATMRQTPHSSGPVGGAIIGHQDQRHVRIEAPRAAKQRIETRVVFG